MMGLIVTMISMTMRGAFLMIKLLIMFYLMIFRLLALTFRAISRR